MSFYLPTNHTWYNYFSKHLEPLTGEWQTRLFQDLEQALFVKGGSVIPILEHDECFALNKCIENGIRLEVYLDENDEASGSIYVDDGNSLDYQSDVNSYA